MIDIMLILRIIAGVMYYGGVLGLVYIVFNGVEELQPWKLLEAPSFYVEFQEIIDLSRFSCWRALIELEKVRIRRRIKEMLPQKFS